MPASVIPDQTTATPSCPSWCASPHRTAEERAEYARVNPGHPLVEVCARDVSGHVMVTRKPGRRTRVTCGLGGDRSMSPVAAVALAAELVEAVRWAGGVAHEAPALAELHAAVMRLVAETA